MRKIVLAAFFLNVAILLIAPDIGWFRHCAIAGCLAVAMSLLAWDWKEL